jgi:hypothetical protein
LACARKLPLGRGIGSCAHASEASGSALMV